MIDFKKEGYKALIWAYRCDYVSSNVYNARKIKHTWGVPVWLWRRMFMIQCKFNPYYKDRMACLLESIIKQGQKN